MQEWLNAQTRARPDGIALIVADRVWTYSELHLSVGKLAGTLRAIGVRAGDFVAVLLPNCAEHVILIHALARIGSVLVPLNTRLTSAELGHPLRVVNAAWLIANDDTWTTAEGAVEYFGASQLLNIGSIIAAENDPVADADIDLDRLQAVVFTSGTTGQPKGASITFGNQFWGAMGSAYRLGTLPDDRWLCCLPLFHVGGLAIVERCCLYGTTVVLQQGFQLEAIIQAVITHHVTLISLVPTMAYRMLNDHEAIKALQLVRLVLIGGAASDSDLLERCTALAIQAAPTYGLSEACSQVVTMLPAEARRKPGCTGKPLLFSAVDIVNEQGNSVSTGTYGEVVVSGKTIMAGYYNNPEATARTLRNGKFYTGDIGYLDQDGDLWLVQRRSDLIVSGGENVYPAEVELVLMRHPAVNSVCVVGVPDAEWGQIVAAVIVLKAGQLLSETEIRTFAGQSLAGYKRPRLIHFIDALPMTGSGKVARRSVSDLFKANADASFHD